MWDRRVFLRNGGLAVLALGAAPRFLTRTALAAADDGRRQVLVAIFLRGGMDALAAVPPTRGNLAKLRPRLAGSAARSAGDERLIDLDNGFALHPELAPLEPLWRSRELAIVHAVGSPDPTRSHFDAQDYMETGTPGRKGTPSGWLNRATTELEGEGSPLRAVAVTDTLPRSLYGPAATVAVPDLDSFRLRSGDGFEEMYHDAAQDILRDGGRDTFEALELISSVRRSVRRSRADYPQTPFGESLRELAALIRADVGLEIGFAELDGWDTHVAQTPVFARQTRDLAQSLSAFWQDLGRDADRVVVLTVTEFGRTVAENGSGGTDHGHGSCLFVLGRNINGGKVHGNLPGLDRDQLYEGRDLPVTTDFRAVFSELATSHLGLRKNAVLFPGWKGKSLPLIQTN